MIKSVKSEKNGSESPKPNEPSELSTEIENALADLSNPVHDRRFFQINNKENSNLIQIFSSVKSVWQGDTWSEVLFRVRLHASIISLTKNQRAPLIVAASIQREMTGRMYGNEQDKKVQIEFGRKTLSDKSYAIVDSDPFHQVKVTLHHTMFEPHESLVLRVDVDQNDGKRDIDTYVFGCSQSICVTKFSFAIEPDFLKNQHAVRTDEGYVWFGKCGTSNSGLDVIVSLKKEDGEIVLSPTPVPFIVELLYDDCLPAPEYALNFHKLRRNSIPGGTKGKPIEKPVKLFTQLTPSPALWPHQSKAYFKFRIEEVSFHHPGHKGFKLRVSALHDSETVIHPATLSDLIIVLSKPKYETGFNVKEHCNSIDKNLKKRSFGLLDSNTPKSLTIPRQVSNGQTSNEAQVNLDALSECFLELGLCMCCKLPMRCSKEFYSTEAHEASCHTVTNLLPCISWYAPTCLANVSAENHHETKPLIETTNLNNLSQPL